MLAIAEGFDESPVAPLLAPHIDPAEILSTPPRPPAVPPRVAQRLQSDLRPAAKEIQKRADALGMRILTPLDEDWPQRLSDQPMAPLVLFAFGDTKALSREPACAVVGSRTPTPYGSDAAKTFCAALVRSEAVLWSGLARGIDRIAHEACVHSERTTVGVLAGSLDQIYPPEHIELAAGIIESHGCLISELPPGRRARRGHFVRRNRLLGAGPTAVLVIEGSLRSGALHTARFASDCSTQVFAVPGPWQSERSQGCHRLILEGAAIAESPEALLQALGLTIRSNSTSLRMVHSADEESILLQLGRGPRPMGLLRRESALAEVAFLKAMFRLETTAAIERLPGDLWRLADLRG